MSELDDQETAARLYNRCWELLEMTRDREQDVELLSAAFSSRYLWSTVGDAQQQIVSDWMVARAAASVGDGTLALLFAQRAHARAQESDLPDWLVASTAEGVARAYAATGDVHNFTAWSALATRLIRVIVDDDDRDLIASQLADITAP